MRRLAMMAAAAAFFGGGAVASAADLGSYKDAPSYAPAPIWTGYYIGAHAGALWNSDRNSSASKKKCERDWYEHNKHWYLSSWDCEEKKIEEVKFEEDDDDISFLGGLHLGYNYQVNSTVLGIEADVSFADDLEYLASLRARLGYARGNLLLYATAGVAFAGLDDDAFKATTNHHTFSYDNDDDRRLGFVVGGGVEYKLRSNWSVGMEGLYYRFGDESNKYSSGSYCTDYDYGKCMKTKKYKFSEDDDNDFWTVRARLTYHFGEDHDSAPLK
jgi:outer membrane immunogenic protein